MKFFEILHQRHAAHHRFFAGLAANVLLTSVGLKSMMQYDAGCMLEQPCEKALPACGKVMQQTATIEVVIPTAGKAKVSASRMCPAGWLLVVFVFSLRFHETNWARCGPQPQTSQDLYIYINTIYTMMGPSTCRRCILLVEVVSHLANLRLEIDVLTYN